MRHWRNEASGLAMNPASRAENEAANPSAGRGEVILVVEDNPEVKLVAVALLEQLNYRTVAVDNAKSALNLLATGTPIDLVFTDVMLPGDLDGVALAQAISKKHPRVPVLLTSGYAKALAGRHGLPILRKPYQISALANPLHTRSGVGRGRATTASLASIYIGRDPGPNVRLQLRRDYPTTKSQSPRNKAPVQRRGFLRTTRRELASRVPLAQ